MKNIPETHKATFLAEFRSPLKMGSVKTTIPSGDQVLVKVRGAGICHSDVHVWEGKWYKGGSPKSLPHIQSHEISGTVAAKGNNVPERIRIGDPVLVYPWQWMEEDKYTIQGLTNISDKPVVPGINIDGGFQEYFLASHYRYLVKANGVEDLAALAPLSCGGLTTYRAVKKTKAVLGPDDFVAVIGLGGLGSYALQYLKILASESNVIGIDIRDDSIEFADRVAGMNASINSKKEDAGKRIREITNGSGIKAVIDLVGRGTVETFSKFMTKQGLYVLVGLMGTTEPESLSPFFTVSMEKTITGSYVGTLNEQHEVVTLARKKIIDIASPISARLTLEQASQGIEDLENGRVLGRQIVVF